MCIFVCNSIINTILCFSALQSIIKRLDVIGQQQNVMMSRIFALEQNQYGLPQFSPNWYPSMHSQNFLSHEEFGTVPPIRSVSGSNSGSTLSISSSDKNSASLIVSDKENSQLPEINQTKLIDPQEVVDKNIAFLNKTKLPTLAVRLARESYFGPEVMIRCTVRGVGSYHALPREQLNKLKKFLQDLALPRLVDRKVEFEELWKLCVISIGQACKQYRIAAAGGKS